MKFFEIGTLGFAFFSYILALIIRNRDITNIEFGKLFSIEISSQLNNRSRKIIQGLAFIFFLFFLLMNIFNTSCTSREIFFYVLVFGCILLFLKLFSLFATELSLLGVKIEQKKEINSNGLELKTIFRSNIFLGALLLFVIWGCGQMVDLNIKNSIASFEEEQVGIQREKSKRSDFIAKYVEKTLLNKNNNNRPVSEDALISRLVDSEGERLFIKGRAGIGKSWFLRSLISKIDEKSEKKIIQLNARDLRGDEPIMSQVSHTIFNTSQCFYFPLVKSELGSGIFIIDGLDEVDFARRDKVETLIANLSESYKSSNIIVTSRPLLTKNISDEFDIFSISSLYKPEVDAMLEGRLKEATNKYLEVYPSLRDSTFSILIPPATEKTEFIIDNLDGSKLREIFLLFLDYYKLNAKNAENQYLLMSTFRDLDIVEDIFLKYLFDTELQGIDDLPIQKFGRTKIFEKWILEKIRVAVKRFENLDESYIDIVFEEINELCTEMYRTNNTISTFTFPERSLRDEIGGYYLTDILSATDLFDEETDYKIFKNHSIDEFFISNSIFRILEEEPGRTKEIISRNNYYSTTEVLPFLAGQYDDASLVMSDIFDGISNNKNQYDYSDLVIYTNHFNRTIPNINFIRDYVSTTSDSIIRDVFNDYLQYNQ